MGWRLFWRIVSFAKISMLLLKEGQVVTTQWECQVPMLTTKHVWIHFITMFALMEREPEKVVCTKLCLFVLCSFMK
jgi:hypothetical protein